MPGSPERAPSRRVLGVGVATLDLIHEVSAYPPEDTELRALAQRRTCGGNAVNSLNLLAQLGHSCGWVGTLADDPASDFILGELARLGIDASFARRAQGGTTPTSCITVSRANGTRTIVHYRDLPELDGRSFCRVSLEGLDWVHFEGRNPDETRSMIRRVCARAPAVGVSLELEKSRRGIDALLEGPWVVLAGRGFAQERGFNDPIRFLDDLDGRTDAALCVVAWGAEGAFYRERGGIAHRVPAHEPARVVDTLGAGDVFNGGVIDGLLGGLPAAEAVAHAVRLAGHKCGRPGVDGLVASARTLGLI